MPESFADIFKRLRLASGQSLRTFCLTHGYDPGNISKLERGRMAPPDSEELLGAYARALGLQADSENWRTFFDQAAAERGRIPDDILSDAELVQKLPILFRTLREATPKAKADMRAFADELRSV